MNYNQIIFHWPTCSYNDPPSVAEAAKPGGFGNYSIITWKKLTCDSNWSNRHRWETNKKWLLPPACTSVFFLTIYPSSAVEGAHLDSSSSHPGLSGWLKRDGRVLLGAGMLGIPRAPRSLQASQAEQATAVLQTSPPSFIYFRWNIDACYERFKIMCLPFALPEHTVSNT